MAPLSEATRIAISKVFAPDRQEEAAELLASYGELPHQREVERVRSCLIQISHGEIARLRKYLNDDYRNLIVWAVEDRRRWGRIPAES